MKRFELDRGGWKLSYLDAGGDGQIIICLHAHWMEAATFTALAAQISPAWRVLALDQRGHGYSGHPDSYTREDYLGDLDAWIDGLELNEPFALLGHSLGGVNAYQYAARRPERVRGLIIEEIGAEIHEAADFISDWAGFFPSRATLEERVGSRFLPSLRDSIRHTHEGWKLAFEPNQLIQSQRNLLGDYWTDWLASDCPALLIRGSQSRLTTAAEFEEMARRRGNTELVELDAGHSVHVDDPVGFVGAVRKFLSAL